MRASKEILANELEAQNAPLQITRDRLGHIVFENRRNDLVAHHEVAFPIAGETFRYTDTGSEGLAGGKKVIVALARGGLYGKGTAQRGIEHAERYLTDALAFIGITDPHFKMGTMNSVVGERIARCVERVCE